MIQAIVIKSATSVRATVIANRTKSDEMGVMKALMIENLKTKLQNGIAHFTFIKKNGELRECWGTTQPNLQRPRQKAMEKVGRTIVQLPFMMWRKVLGEVSDGNRWLKYSNLICKGCQLLAFFFILLTVKQ